MATSILSLATVALLGAAFLPPRDAPFFPAPPQPGVAQAAPLTIAWHGGGVPDYYLVELFAGGELTHATSVRGTHLALPAWLPPGRYSWRVYAGTGAPSERRLSGPVEQGWIRVRDPAS